MKKDEEMDRQRKIHNTHKMIEDWKNELSMMAACENLQPQIDAVNNELKKLQEERANIDSDISDLTAEKMNQEREKKSKLLVGLFVDFSSFSYDCLYRIYLSCCSENNLRHLPRAS